MAVNKAAVKDIRSPRSSVHAGAFIARRPCVVATATLLLLSWVGQSQAQFIPPSNETCACSGEVLTYTCNVKGGAATVWNGTAFTCVQGSINLLHSDGRQGAECNGIVGQLIPEEDQLFTSELMVTVSSELNGATVACSVSSRNGLTSVGISSIVVTSGEYQQMPNARLTNSSDSRLQFSWDSVDPSCPSISYEMTTSGCGTCSIATNTTTATCTGWQLPSMCAFSVQSVICGFTGPPSSAVEVTLKVPSPPQVDIIPTYSVDTNSLANFIVTINQATNITDPLFGAITEYTTSYSGGVQRNTSCADDQCEYEVRGPFQDCSTSSTTSVSVSASNVFGQGQASSPQSFGCANTFVRAEYMPAVSVITCKFLDTTDTSLKSCTVMYGECGQQLTQKVEGNSTSASIRLQLDPGESSECYTVTASNGTLTIRVDNRVKPPQGSTSTVTVVIIVVFSIAAAFILVSAIVTVIIFVLVLRSRKSKCGDTNIPDSGEMSQGPGEMSQGPGEMSQGPGEMSQGRGEMFHGPGGHGKKAINEVTVV